MGLLWNCRPQYSLLKGEVTWQEGENKEEQTFCEVFEVVDSKTSEFESTKEYLRLRRAALIISWISVVFGFSTGVAAVVLGNIFGSESLFGYGLDAVLDSLSSVAVLWRFYSHGTHASAEEKERKACIIISLLFFVSTASLLFKSINSLSKGTRDGDIDEVERIVTDLFSTVCGTVAVTLASLKVYYGKRLESRSLLTDSIITFVGAVVSVLGVLSLELYMYDESIWYLDPIFGMLCGVFLFFFGLKLLIQMTCCYQRGSHNTIPESNHVPSSN